MGLIGKLLGGSISETVKGVASVFSPNKEAQSQRDQQERVAVRNQYASEFNVHSKRTWFDSFVDGANRLVRPVMSYSVIAFFVVFIYDVDAGLNIAKSLSIIPAGMWALLSIIIGFYFTGRMKIKADQFKIQKEQIDIYKSLSDDQKEKAEDVADSEYKKAMNDTSKTLPNKVILEWNRRRLRN